MDRLAKRKEQGEPSLTTHGKFTPGGRSPLMAMVEITGRCNMRCPVCFADVKDAGGDPSLEVLQSYFQQLLDVSGQPVPVQISGGEPTLRQDLPEIIAMAQDMGFWHIELVTNGLMIAEQPDLLPLLRKNGLTAVYLQFDGVSEQTHLKLRGQDMRQVRAKAVAAVRSAGLCCTLAVMVARGVNEHEIKPILDFALEQIDVVRAINFQTATPFDGRYDIERQTGFSLPQLLQLIETQTGISATSFRSNALGGPGCNAMSMVFQSDGKLKPLFSYLSERDIKRFLGSQPAQAMFELFRGRESFFKTQLGRLAVLRLLMKARPIFGLNPFSVRQSQHLLIFAKSFMEKNQLDSVRIDHCCYGISAEGGVYSFCAYNNTHRFADTASEEA